MVMDHVEVDTEELLENWRKGHAKRADLYRAVRKPMYQAARQGIGRITSLDPDPQDVEDVVYVAFEELERQDPAEVASLVGLAKRIAFRRGQDAGRKIIREREQMRAMMIDLIVTDVPASDDEVRAAADEEVLVGHALECLDRLPEDQRDVVEATVMRRENLSDWALRKGKSHQAASRQRDRAVAALRRCIELTTMVEEER